MAGTKVNRMYLYVPPEEEGEVEALGAHWDESSKCWYIGAGEDPDRFSQWLPQEQEEDEGFTITSDQAYVASASALCWKCHTNIEVICIYCESGFVADEPLNQFTVCRIWAMDGDLT